MRGAETPAPARAAAWAARRPSLALPVALGLALAAAPARAAVEGSPHDLIAQGYDVVKTRASQDRCVVCHAAARAASRKLVHDVPPSLRERYGAGSLVCFSCHDGITIVALEADASMTAFHPAGHGEDQAKFRALQAQGAGLPSAKGERLECTTCHDPHDNSRRPFLRAPLGEICLLCHAPLAEVPAEGGGNSSGNHPVGRDPAAVVRKEAPTQTAPEFAVPFPSAYPSQGGKGGIGIHWDLGGHLLKGSAGELACVTCHAIHGDEAAPPAPSLLVRDPVGDIADEFCEACHRGQRGDGGAPAAAPNPGGTRAGRTYHPCDDDVANGAGRLVEIEKPGGWPFGGGSPPRLICTTCHSAHGGEAGTQLLRAPGEGKTFCEACHATLPLANHHPTGAATKACASSLPPDARGLARLSCERCHRAHNAGLGAEKEQEYVPLLRAPLLSVEQCASCHPAGNPTCGTDPERLASHFLGDPSAPDTYDNPEPPLRTDVWPDSGAASLYGKGESGKTLICLSCHSFRSPAAPSGDKGTARFLLARSGNQIEWSDGQEAGYLCLGCHGVNPSTGEKKGGHMHPLMNAAAEKLGRDVAPPGSLTPTGRVNCDSCHRPHEAVTKSGRYMLEAVSGANEDPLAIRPKIDFTVTCHLCHDPGKY